MLTLVFNVWWTYCYILHSESWILQEWFYNWIRARFLFSYIFCTYTKTSAVTEKGLGGSGELLNETRRIKFNKDYLVLTLLIYSDLCMYDRDNKYLQAFYFKYINCFSLLLLHYYDVCMSEWLTRLYIYFRSYCTVLN